MERTFLIESGVMRQAGKKPDYYTPLINRLNLMKNRDSDFDTEVAEKIAYMIAKIDRKFIDEMYGVTKTGRGHWQYRHRDLNDKVVRNIIRKTLTEVLEAKKNYLENLLR